MLARRIDELFRRPAEFLQDGWMARLGIRNTLRLARRYDGLVGEPITAIDEHSIVITLKVCVRRTDGKRATFLR